MKSLYRLVFVFITASLLPNVGLASDAFIRGIKISAEILHEEVKPDFSVTVYKLNELDAEFLKEGLRFIPASFSELHLMQVNRSLGTKVPQSAVRYIWIGSKMDGDLLYETIAISTVESLYFYERKIRKTR